MTTVSQLTERTAQTVAQATAVANIGRRKLSELTEISYGQLGRMLQGRVAFDIVDLYMIAQACKIPPANLLPSEFTQAVSA